MIWNLQNHFKVNPYVLKQQFRSFKLQFIMKFGQHFSWNSLKFCNKLHLKLFSCLEIPCQLHEKKGNFMLFKFGNYKFFSKRLHFFKKLKKPNLLRKKQCYFWIHDHCFSASNFRHQMSATLIKIANCFRGNFPIRYSIIKMLNKICEILFLTISVQ